MSQAAVAHLLEDLGLALLHGAGGDLEDEARGGLAQWPM